MCRPIWISPMGNSGRLLRGKPAATESRYPTYGACWMFGCFHNPPNSDMDYRIFIVRTDVNACTLLTGVYGRRKRVCTETSTRRKIPRRTEESNLPQRRAGPTLYQLSYIPTLFFQIGKDGCLLSVCPVNKKLS